MRASSSQKDLAVYNFDEKEEAVEAESQKYAARFQSRLSCQRKDSTAADKSITKYTFLHAFTSGLNLKQGGLAGIVCIDLPKTDKDRPYTTEIPDQNLAPTDGKIELDEVVPSPTRYDVHDQMDTDGVEDCLLGRDITADGFSGDKESWPSLSRFPMTIASDIDKTEGCQPLPCSKNICSILQDMYHNDEKVLVVPDFVIYESTVYGESQLVFSSDCLKIECSDASGNDEKLVAQWASADIIHIRCRWSGVVDAALVELLLKSTENAKFKKSDVETVTEAVRIRFSVNDMQWLEKEQKIRNLSVWYNDAWNNNSSDGLVWEVDDMGGMSFSRDYFLEIEEPFDDVIYPKGDPDAVSISKRDIDLLQPETFINDTIIDFYIKYLKNKIDESEKHRFHFFNSFFFRKLADLDKDRFHDSEGRAAFLRVRKWTRKVNIFEKDFIFIPVNFNLHWSLLVICHPGELVKLKDDLKESPKVPCILHMDSIRGSHSGLKNIIQSYIWEEWKERHPESVEIDSSKFSCIRFVELELPQQENSFDCGLFLLHYVELFLEEAPVNFNPFKLMKYSNFLNADWFSPGEASLKRMLIRKLIYDLLNDSIPKVASAPADNCNTVISGCQDHDAKQPLVGLMPKQCSPDMHALGGTVCSDTGRGTNSLPTFDTSLYNKHDRPFPREFMEPARLPASEVMAHADHSASFHEVDHEGESGELATTQTCMSLPPVNESSGMPLSSMTVQDCDRNFLVRPLDVSCTVQSEKTDCSEEDCGYVPDSQDSGHVCGEDLMEIDAGKDEQINCKDTERFHVEAGNNHSSSCNHPTPDKSEVNDKKDLEVPTGHTREDPTTASVVENETDQQISSTGAAVIRSCQEIACVEVNGSDTGCQGVSSCQDISHVEANDGREIAPAEVNKSDEMARFEVNESDSVCPEIQPDSSQDLVVSDCEMPCDADDVQLIDTQLVGQQPSKRRKLMLYGRRRIRTRSCSREHQHLGA